MTTRRATQAVVEIDYIPDPTCRATQTLVEVEYIGTPTCRATQVIVEVEYTPVVAIGTATIYQAILEVAFISTGRKHKVQHI